MQANGHAPKAAPNPARQAAELLGRFSMQPGWADFQLECSLFANLASTPGWEVADGPGGLASKTHPNAKPIGLAQWGTAIATAGMLAEAVPGLGFPKPGIDPDGFIWLNWRHGACEFALELHANLLHQDYRWQRVLDGFRQNYDTTQLGDVVEALKAYLSGARREHS